MDVPCRRCGGRTHECKASDLAYGFACIHCDECDESWQEQDGRPKKERRMSKTNEATEKLHGASLLVTAALGLMNERSTNCTCGSRRYENHKEHQAAQEMRSILARIEKVKHRLAEMSSKED